MSMVLHTQHTHITLQMLHPQNVHTFNLYLYTRIHSTHTFLPVWARSESIFNQFYLLIFACNHHNSSNDLLAIERMFIEGTSHVYCRCLAKYATLKASKERSLFCIDFRRIMHLSCMIIELSCQKKHPEESFPPHSLLHLRSTFRK